MLALATVCHTQWVHPAGFNAAGLQVVGAPAVGLPGVAATRYHAQDELGQASFGYAHPGQAASNYRDALGNQIGSYAYFNPEGKEIRVAYTADHRGFRVLSNNLPSAPAPVQDTAEVAAAKANHMAALTAAKTKVAPITPGAPIVPIGAASAKPMAAAPMVIHAAPTPVQDTPEVAAAKRDHAARWYAAKAATDAANARNYATVPFGYYPYGYGHPMVQQIHPYSYPVRLQ